MNRLEKRLALSIDKKKPKNTEDLQGLSIDDGRSIWTPDKPINEPINYIIK